MSGNVNFKNHTAEALASAGEKISRSVMGLSSAMREYQDRVQKVENELAAEEVLALWREKNSALEAQMAENPASYNEYEKWATELDNEFQEEAAPIYEKMSPEYRKLSETKMRGIRAESLNSRRKFVCNAQSTVLYNQTKIMLKDAAMRGDQETYKRLLEGPGSTVFNEAEKTEYALAYDRLAERYEVERLLDNNTPGVADMLKERNEDGSYVYYGKLDTETRRKFINQAKAQAAIAKSNDLYAFVDDLNSGKIITFEMLDDEFSSKLPSGFSRDGNWVEYLLPEDQELYYQKRSTLRKYNEANAKAKARQESKESAAEKRMQQAEYDKGVKKMRWQIFDYKFSPDVASAQVEYAELKNKILETYPADSAARLELVKQLDISYKAATDPTGEETAYRNSFNYNIIKTEIENTAFVYADKDGDVGDGDDEDVMSVIAQQAFLHMDEFFYQNPDASYEDAMKELETFKSQVSEVQMNNLADLFAEQSLRLKNGTEGRDE
jgi:hypothetical protein